MAESVIQVLKNDQDKIVDLLEKAGFDNIRRGQTIKFRFDPPGHGSCQINPETLTYIRRSNNESGRIFDAIMSKKGFKFPEAVRWCKYHLGVSNSNISEIKKKSKVEIFGGFFKDEYDDYNTYSYREIFTKYPPCISQRFLDDGISAETQIFFNIAYDPISERIVIPWKDKYGLIVGCNKRANFEFSEDYRYKYITEGFDKSKFMYGLYENQKYIKNSFVIVVESEKSVQQAYDFGFRNILALGSSGLNSKHVNMLVKEYNIKSLIFMLDQGSKYLETYDKIFDRIEKLCDNLPEMWYLADDTRLGIKSSPTDHGKEIFEYLIKNCLKISRSDNER